MSSVPGKFQPQGCSKETPAGPCHSCESKCSQGTDQPLLANAGLSEPYSVSHNASPAHYSTTYSSPGQLPSTSRAVTDQAFTTSRAVHEQRLVASGMASGQLSVSHRASEPQPSTSRDPSTASTYEPSSVLSFVLEDIVVLRGYIIY